MPDTYVFPLVCIGLIRPPQGVFLAIKKKHTWRLTMLKKPIDLKRSGKSTKIAYLIKEVECQTRPFLLNNKINI